ncbi:hypothetical protein FNQ90_09300 [Streptomyces alkaliphilus]|uniref:Uncharacterized protein n=1 Tax=Streptomyces alkaliphilus TaxID=1472722 RepID=A0A7W3TCS7_9ACTN|nr:hypothetical protein [Streptomyces alkaliphilus]MBB0244295.1 hypothetical protein [Streptomyces alkaliphilus]
MGIPPFLAGFDSSSGMLRANACFLRDEPFTAMGESRLLEVPITATRLLPPRVREKVFIGSGATETISPKRMGRIDMEEVSEWVAEEYPRRRYPAVAVGSACGALTHLWTALGVPWLPQTFLIPVRQRVHPDDPGGAMFRGLEPGAELVRRNPEIQLHHMHDANQDRMMVRALTYFRVKRLELGPTWERFLLDRLEPGGTIIVSECATRWRTTRVGPRHVFQHGALGGATEEEFHHGGPRVAEYLERYDSPVRRWYGPEPDGDSPEAEWGFEPALREDIERFARANGFRVRRVVFDEPEAPSPLVADLYRDWYARRSLPTNRLAVSSFILTEPRATLMAGAVPFWMKFNTEVSHRALRDYLDAEHREPFDEILLGLFQNGVEAVGLTTIDEWRDLLGRAHRKGRFLGLRTRAHPRDLAHFVRYGAALRRLRPHHPLPEPLTLEDLDDFLERAREEDEDRYPGVRFETLHEPVGSGSRRR